MKKIPAFVRGMVTRAAESCRKRGLDRVTVEELGGSARGCRRRSSSNAGELSAPPLTTPTIVRQTDPGDPDPVPP